MSLYHQKNIILHVLPSLCGALSGLHNEAVSVEVVKGEEKNWTLEVLYSTQKMERMLLFIYNIIFFDFLVTSGMKGNYL